jgi:anti-sigma factor RsiW
VDCELIQRELSAYHFGVVDDETRGALEEHLQRCPECLRDYLALKREIETASLREAPSPLAKARLLRAVRAELGVATRAWWERPLALGCAAAAVALAISCVELLAASPGSAPRTLAAAGP